MSSKSNQINYPFFSSNDSVAKTSSPDAASSTAVNDAKSNMLKFKQVPDYLGNGIINVKVKFWTNQQNYTVLLYCLSDEHDGMNLNFITSIQCQSDKYRYQYTTPQGISCSGYLAVLVLTSQMGTPIQTLNAKDIMTVPGYAKFISSGPITASTTITQITTGIKSWTNSQSESTFKSFDLNSNDDDQPVLPSLDEMISQLESNGVPSNFFTTDVKNNIQIIINQNNQDAKEILKLARSNGSTTKEFFYKSQSISWSCFWCKIGFGVAITLAACIITATLIALLPTGAGGAIAGGLAAYLVTWFNITAAVASTVSTGLLSSIGTVITVSIAKILDNLAELLCEATGTCGSH